MKQAPKKLRTTLKDVAAACGLSHMTVSLALRGSSEIPPATRERVLKAAQDLRYVPHESARRMKGAGSGKIAYVASRLAHGFVGKVLVGIEQRAFETKKYLNAIQPFSTWFQVQAKNDALHQILYGGLADAVIMASCAPEPAMIKEFNRHGVPLVLIEEKRKGCHSVRVDNVAGAKVATRQLLSLGCKRLALVAGVLQEGELDLNPTSVERREGFAQGLKGAGLKADPRRMADIRFYDIGDGKKALDELLRADPKIDGIFCAAGDLVAFGILERARELKLKVPRDLKIIGFDDIEFARLLQPALSTVRQPVEELGARAFDLAVSASEGKLAEETHLLFKPELVLRGTT